MIGLVASPHLRIKLLLQTRLTTYKTYEMALNTIEQQFKYLKSIHHELIYRYQFNTIFQHIQATAIQWQIDLSLPENKLFILR